MTQGKEDRWRGYYQRYLRQAESEGVHAFDVLDRRWADSKRYAEQWVLPLVSSTSDVLEIAAGIGRYSRFVAPRCKTLTCTDILDECIGELNENLADFDNIRIVKTNGYDLASFADESFDCVYSITAFFHFDFELVVSYFAEITRVLRPKGTVLLEFKEMRTERHLKELLDKIEKRGLEQYEQKPDKWRYVSVEALELLCRHHELEIISSDITHFTFAKRG